MKLPVRFPQIIDRQSQIAWSSSHSLTATLARGVSYAPFLCLLSGKVGHVPELVKEVNILIARGQFCVVPLNDINTIPKPRGNLED